jgi:carboxyl-terminal processing protease
MVGMKRLTVLVAAVACAAACSGSPSTAPTAMSPSPAQVPNASRLASDYTNELLNVMQTNSINRDRINWTDLRGQVIERARGAQTIADLYPAVSLALGLLDDHHSFYQAPGGGGVGNPRSPRCTATAAAPPMVPADIGYVRVSAFSSGVAGADRTFADEVQQQIRSRDRADLSGWIVDLRGNGGGNMWPMVAGVGPVLGDGVAGYFVPPSGAAIPWSFQGGSAISGSSEIVRTSAMYVLMTRAPRVAVLTDALVASSGEAVAVSFRGRPNTRSFGAATCGLSTANSGFRLSDGATLQLTTALMADRNRTAYGISIVPDEAVSGDGEVIQRAVAWLRGE